MEPDVEVETTPQDKGSSSEASDYNDVASEKAALEMQLADEINLRRFTENVLDCRQQELELQEHQMTSKLDALKKELANTQRQLAEARDQNKANDKQLQEAKDQVFRLQPRRNDITEAEAREGYKNLCGNVQRWVENRMSGVLDDLDEGRLRTRTAPPHAARFVGLLREASRRCLNVDQSDEYHVIGAIMNYLWLAIFSRSFYVPLDDTQGDGTVLWIDELESTMYRLPRDVSHCREWRSETLTALTSQPVFKTRRTRHLNLISDDLTAILSIFAPKTPSAELRASIRESIIDPAADLAHRLHLAPTIYSLKWPARTAPSRVEVYECLNLASGGLILDLTGTNKDSQSRRNVTYLFDVSPGLFVERVEMGKKHAPRAIVKPTVLINKADGEVPQKPTLIKWLWDNAGPPPIPGRAPARTAGPKTASTVSGRSTR
ncbi:hypothetical protein B0T10DRAFT_67040 [Thelonectria olida]|uniref:Uncharacterized protein n=1 Tax=Thelonectria olida TaxID=1576542 RepID=A0A9P8W3F1_9HYPO|nr:hypothetical protein B0T10DRAFT_67040 [Thelonectria olida]